MRWRVLAPIAGALVAGVVAAVLVSPFVTTTGRVGPAEVAVRARLSPGGHTEVLVGPLGRAAVDSHDAPLSLEVRIEQVDVPSVQRLAEQDDIEANLRRDVSADLAALARMAALRLLVVTALAGAVAGALVPGVEGRARRARNAAVGLAGALVVTGSSVGWTAAGLRTEAFRTPQLSGALASVPDVLDAVEREFGDLDGVRDRLSVLTDRVAAVGRSLGPAGDEAEVRILHVSDVHLNPVGLELARQAAEAYDVVAVIDTGDLTSFGLDAESRIGALIDRFPVPYVFVPGNHDSPHNRSALGNHRNVTVLDRDVIDLGGVRVLGVADPGYSAYGGIPGMEARALRDDVAPEVARLVERTQPDVLAVAGVALAGRAYGDVPLVISGDVHKRTEALEDGTRVLTVGSTGATGLGSLTLEEERPYELEVLRFVDGHLTGVDYLSVQAISGALQLDRTTYPS